jgi:hypothetical protein
VVSPCNEKACALGRLQVRRVPQALDKLGGRLYIVSVLDDDMFAPPIPARDHLFDRLAHTEGLLSGRAGVKGAVEIIWTRF